MRLEFGFGFERTVLYAPSLEDVESRHQAVMGTSRLGRGPWMTPKDHTKPGKKDNVVKISSVGGRTRTLFRCRADQTINQNPRRTKGKGLEGLSNQAIITTSYSTDWVGTCMHPSMHLGYLQTSASSRSRLLLMKLLPITLSISYTLEHEPPARSSGTGCVSLVVLPCATNEVSPTKGLLGERTPKKRRALIEGQC